MNTILHGELDPGWKTCEEDPNLLVHEEEIGVIYKDNAGRTTLVEPKEIFKDKQDYSAMVYYEVEGTQIGIRKKMSKRLECELALRPTTNSNF